MQKDRVSSRRCNVFYSRRANKIINNENKHQMTRTTLILEHEKLEKSGALNEHQNDYLLTIPYHHPCVIHCHMHSPPPFPQYACYSASTSHSPNADVILGKRLRRWPNITPALGKCLFLAWHHVKGGIQFNDG